MPTVDEMKATVERYVAAHTAGDVDAIAAVFAVDAVLTDPVDQPAHHGREAIKAFFAATHEFIDAMDFQVTGPIRAVGEWAAVPLRAVSTIGDAKVGVDIIDVFTFDQDGLISDMKAYWSSADIRPVED